MKIKNNKGFTLPELLAAVVIIGILSSIAIVSVNNVMKKSHKEYDIKQNKLFTTAAQTYFTDNRSELPKKLLTESEVTLSELIKENYIEEIVDYKKELYNQNESKAYVKKMGRGKYKYYSELIGSDGRKISDKEESKKSGDIKITITNYDRSETDMPRSNNLNIETYYVNKKLKIGIQGSATGEGISSYQYKIERLKNERDKTGKKYKESGEIEVDNKILNDTITIDAKDFANGIYKLVVYAYGYDGNTFNTVESKKIVIDKTKPKCNIEMDGTLGFGVENAPGNYWYKKGNLTAKMKIKEQNKYKYTIGLDEQTYDIKYNKNNINDIEEYPITNNIVGKYVYGYIQDKAGNIGKCQTEKPIYYDNTNPTCEIKLNPKEPNGNNEWYMEFVKLYLYSFDIKEKENESGIRDQALTITNQHIFPIFVPKVYTNITEGKQEDTNNEGQMWYGYVRDKAGNEGSCKTENHVKVDTKRPKCITKISDGKEGIIDGSKTGWYTSDVGIKGECSDASSGCVSDIYNNETKEGTMDVSPGTVKDNAGWQTKCNTISVKIDKTSPKCYGAGVVSGTLGNNNWYITDTKSWAECNESLSGSGCSNKRILTVTGASEKVSNKYYDSYREVNANGTSYLQWRVIDNAGNVSNDVCSQTIKVDKEPPTLSITKDANSTIITATCTDSGGSGLISLHENVKFDGSGRNSTCIRISDSHIEYNNSCSVDGSKACINYHSCLSTDNPKKTKFKCEDAAGHVVIGHKEVHCDTCDAITGYASTCQFKKDSNGNSYLVYD